MRRIVFARHGTDDVAHVRDHVGVLDHDLIRAVLTQIGKFAEHLVRGLEVERRLVVRVAEPLPRHQDAAECLVLRLEEVHVAGRAAGFAQLVCETQDVAIPVAQLLFILGLTLFDHEPVVADGLDLEIIVEGRKPLELVPLRVTGQRAEHLARFACGAENQPFAVADELAARHDRPLVVVFQKALGNQLIEVSEPRLIFHQNDEVVARQVLQLVLAVGRRGKHGVDIRYRDRVHLVLEPCQQLYKNAPQHSCVLARAVVLERADLQLFGQDVQLELMQVRQHQAGHFQRIDRGKVPLDGQAPQRRAQKAHIEPCVVRDERVLSLPRPREELGHRLVEVGRVRDCLVRNAGQLGDLLRDGLVRIDIGLERVLDRAVHHTAGRDFGDFLARGVESGGLEVEHDECAVERLG